MNEMKVESSSKSVYQGPPVSSTLGSICAAMNILRVGNFTDLTLLICLDDKSFERIFVTSAVGRLVCVLMVRVQIPAKLGSQRAGHRTVMLATCLDFLQLRWQQKPSSHHQP